MLSLLSAFEGLSLFGSIIALLLPMNKILCFALLISLLNPAYTLAQSDLGFLDNFVDFLTPKDSKAKDSKKVTALQKELRKTIKAVSNRYERLDDPAGLKAYSRQKTKTKGKRIESTKYNKLLKKLRQSCNRKVSDEKLKTILNNFLQKKGISVKPSVRIRKVRKASKVEELGNWLANLYDKHISSR